MSRTLSDKLVFLLGRIRDRIIIGAIVLIVVLVLNSWLLLSYKLPGTNLFWSALQNAGHALIFLGLAMSASLILHHFFLHQKKWHTVAVTFCLCLLFGGAVELIQAQVGRSASWDDFGLDAVGTVAGLCFYLAIYWHRWYRALALSLCFILVAISLVEPIKWRLAEHYRIKAFPVLADFDNRWLNLYVKPTYGARMALGLYPNIMGNNLTKKAKLTMGAGSWPGLSLGEVHRDWHGFKTFSFDVFNPQAHEVTLVVRIHDRAHDNRHNDRFNRTITLAAGRSQIDIPISLIKNAPKDRLMALEHIETVMFYSYKLKDEVVLYFDNIQLRP